MLLTDLGNFSGRTRSAVSVREDQGVVLLCSPPPHSPGIVGSILYCCCSPSLHAHPVEGALTREPSRWNVHGFLEMCRSSRSVMKDHILYISPDKRLSSYDNIVLLPISLLTVAVMSLPATSEEYIPWSTREVINKRVKSFHNCLECQSWVHWITMCILFQKISWTLGCVWYLSQWNKSCWDIYLWVSNKFIVYWSFFGYWNSCKSHE